MNSIVQALIIIIYLQNLSLWEAETLHPLNKTPFLLSLHPQASRTDYDFNYHRYFTQIEWYHIALFPDWFMWLNLMHQSFIYVIAWVRISLSFTAFCCMYIPFLIDLFTCYWTPKMFPHFSNCKYYFYECECENTCMSQWFQFIICICKLHICIWIKYMNTHTYLYYDYWI